MKPGRAGFIQRHQFLRGFGIGFRNAHTAGAEERRTEIRIAERGDLHALAAPGAVDELAVPNVYTRMIPTPGMPESHDISGFHFIGINRRTQHGLFPRGTRERNPDAFIGPLHETRAVEPRHAGPAANIRRTDSRLGALDKMHVRERNALVPHTRHRRRTVIVGKTLFRGHSRTIGPSQILVVVPKGKRIVDRPLFGSTPRENKARQQQKPQASAYFDTRYVHWARLENFSILVNMRFFITISTE